MNEKYDFIGWATKCDIRCLDGRTIKKNAFKDCDGETVPLVWNHDHKDPFNVLGHALLENRDEGVYAYCSFNNSESGQNAKEMVKHGDIRSLSIYATELKQNGGDVIHGLIREVSLVLAGANRGAVIENVLSHSGELNDEKAIIFNNVETLELSHSEEKDMEIEETKKTKQDENKETTSTDQNEDEETIGEIFEDLINKLNEKQKKTIYALIGQAYEDGREEGLNTKEEENKEDMKHNVFDNENKDETLQHSADILEAIKDAKSVGSMKKAFLAHGITNIEYLFPEAHEVNGTPTFLRNGPTGWVKKVMAGVHKLPFSRVRMTVADISQEQARAKGYVKDAKKEDEVFALLKRTIDPQTVYKHQSMNRDDILDITDFDSVAWVKAEMRDKLDEELARAFIFGDGRTGGDQYKIKEANIVPVIKDTDQDLYAMKFEVDNTKLENIIDAAVLAQGKYEGSGNLVGFFKNTDVSQMLILRDKLGRRIYKDIKELATSMAISEIIQVPDSFVPEGFIGVILDLYDYGVGSDKGGSVNMFEDFDIDYNREKYLIETRCSGGLNKPHSAIVLTVKPGED